MLRYTLIFIILEINFFISIVNGLIVERLVGGTFARRGEFKYQVSVQADGEHICCGGILDSNFVITAAHCIIISSTSRFIKQRLTVVANVLDTYEPDEFVETREVIKLYVPKIFKTGNWGRNVSHYANGDVAILKLKQGFNINPNSGLMKLEITENISYQNQTLVVAGQGYSRTQVIQSPESKIHKQIGYSDGILRFANVNILSDNECFTNYRSFISFANICAKMVQRDRNNPEGLCIGDSGTPLVSNGNILVAIASANDITCFENEIPAVYTNVSYYTRFIIDAMRDTKTPDMIIAKWKRKNLFHFRYSFVETCC